MGPNRRRALPLALAALVAVLPGSVLAGVAPVQSVGVADAVDDTYSVDEDTDLVVDAPGLLENDVPGGAMCVVAVGTTGLRGSIEFDPDGSFTFSPDANFHGATSFTYGARTGVGLDCPEPPEDVATVTITVDPVNDPPTASADSFQALANRTLNVGAPGVLGNDSDIDGDSLTASKVSNPAHGVVVLAADGAFSYTPSAGYVGPDAFSYRASDGDANSATRIVTLTVTALPPPPTPAPLPTPTPAPTATPEITPSPAPSDSPAPSVSPDPLASPSLAPSPLPTASPAPGATPGPDPSTAAGGLSLPVLAVLALLIALLAFGAAVYVPKWVRAQQTGQPTDIDEP